MNASSSTKPEPWAWHLLGLLTPVLVASGNVAGGWWVLAGFVFVEILGPVLDIALGEDERARPARASGLPFEVLLYVHALLHFVALGALLYRASLDGAAWTTLGATVSTGLSSGVSGIIVAHEFGHGRPRSLRWWIGQANLLSVLYLHFTTEHNHTHHRLVGTRDDPATARRGESLWAFVVRTIPAQFSDAVGVHASRGKTGWHSPALRGLALQLALIVTVFAFAGPWVAGAFVLQAAIAVFQLEYINYIRHYGLERGVDERQTARHSWQAEQRWSRWTLMELTRHPAHHLKASVLFWQLRPHDDAPTLPTGYYGSFWIAVVPALWRRVMEPRIPRV